MSAAGFMQKTSENASALPWLAGAASLASDGAPVWVRALRETAQESFLQTGLPTNAWEGWQHFNLRAVAAQAFHYIPAPAVFDAAKLPAPLLDGAGRIVMVNGRYQPELSQLPAGVTVMGLMDAAHKNVPGLEEYLVNVGDFANAPFMALNAAHLRDGMILTVGKGKIIDQPVEVLFYNTGRADQAPAIYPRVLYWLGQGAQLNIIERHMGAGVYFANSHISIVTEQTARLGYYRFEEESAEAFHFSTTTLRQEKDSYFESFAYAAGARVAREEFRNMLIDSGIYSSISGVYLLKNQQNHDFTILMDHFEPNGKSVQHLRGVIDDQARSVFQGKIQVRRPAQKTDGNQSSHALLLSDQAEASFKPELEIYADDVKCTHGATSGRLDAGALFYLRSRGIPEHQARGLLIQSFLGETLDGVSFAPVADVYAEKIAAWLTH